MVAAPTTSVITASVATMAWLDGGYKPRTVTLGTETSAEVLVGAPGRMVSNAGQQQWYEGRVRNGR
jgi:hypothetical protein